MVHVTLTHILLSYFSGVLISFIILRRKHRKDFTPQTWESVMECLALSLFLTWSTVIFWLISVGSTLVNRLRKYIGSQLRKEPPKWL